MPEAEATRQRVPERRVGYKDRPLTEGERVLMTVSCRDADSLPKVGGAGEVYVREEDGVRVQRMHNGLLVEADRYLGEYHTEIVRRLQGHFEPQEEVVFQELLKLLPRQAVMIELGAWWAYYSLWFKSLHPRERRAIAVEPVPAHRELARRNAGLNGLDLELDSCLIADRAGRRPWTDDTGVAHTVDCKTPAGFFEEHGISGVDVFHMDIQGGELGMVGLLRPLLESGKIRFMFLATHHHQITGDPLTHQKCIAALEAAGCRILEEFDVQESFGGDGLILACAGGVSCAWPGVRLTRNRASTSLYRNPLYDVAEWRGKADQRKAKLEAWKRRGERSLLGRVGRLFKKS